jgi:prepilin-type N-terminal cleavage/methylation domain-containing protein/prepilin-type processing-associated H-X9-DG protein
MTADPACALPKIHGETMPARFCGWAGGPSGIDAVFNGGLGSRSASQAAGFRNPLYYDAGLPVCLLVHQGVRVFSFLRRGFTLIELLVVIAIIGVLIALMLPAVQGARASARRSQCASNLKQLVLAIMSYENDNGALPPTAICASSDATNACFGRTPDFSMKARLLPFLDQEEIYNALNFSALFNDVVNTTVRCQRISIFICPSDGNNPAQGITVTTGGFTGSPGTTSYPNNIGTFAPENASGNIDGPAYYPGGAAPSSDTVTLATITDGTSNTAIFSEYTRFRSTTQNGVFQIYQDTRDSAKVAAPLLALFQNCQAAVPIAPAGGALTSYDGMKGLDWLFQHCGNGGCYSHVMPPNKKACYFSASKTAGHPTSTLIGASSYHPGGVNVAFLDGSVRFIKDSIGPQIWWALATKAGGEILSGNGY